MRGLGDFAEPFTLRPIQNEVAFLIGHQGDHGVARGKPLPFPTVAIHHALDAIPQALHIEINEQPDPDAAQSHV